MSEVIPEDLKKLAGHERLLWLTQEYKKVLAYAQKQIEAGLTPAVAFQTAFAEIHRLYERVCSLENVAPVNHMIDPTSIDLQARFALDALFGALKGQCEESQARSAFWLLFRKVTNPHVTL